MIEVKNLFFSYEKGRRILDDINFNIENGKLVSVIGPNESGKTTLVKCINNILTKESGEVFINNENTEKKTKKELAKLIGYTINPNMPLRCLEYISRLYETLFESKER